MKIGRRDAGDPCRDGAGENPSPRSVVPWQVTPVGLTCPSIIAVALTVPGAAMVATVEDTVDVVAEKQRPPIIRTVIGDGPLCNRELASGLEGIHLETAPRRRGGHPHSTRRSVGRITTSRSSAWRSTA